MSKKASFSLIIACVVVLCVIISGCTTAASRRQDKRLEELERRVSKIEFEYDDSPEDEGDYSRYIQQAKLAPR